MFFILQDAAGQHPCAPPSDTRIPVDYDAEQTGQCRVGALSAHILGPPVKLLGLDSAAFTLKLGGYDVSTYSQCCKPHAMSRHVPAYCFECG